MSKIGATPITIPDSVSVDVQSRTVVVKGPKEELEVNLQPGISITIEESLLRVNRKSDSKQHKSNHGLVRSLIANCIEGVTDGFKKTLKLVGTGYRVKKKGSGLEVTVGYSHPVTIEPVPGVKLDIEGDDTIHVSGIDKQKVGQVAADIRLIKPPEVYKGKGIRYEGEVVKLKPGKAAIE